MPGYLNHGPLDAKKMVKSAKMSVSGAEGAIRNHHRAEKLENKETDRTKSRW